MIVGLILGDPAKGTLIGAAINLIYLGFISAGGSIPGDPALAGWVGTTLALASNLDYAQALAIAVPIVIAKAKKCGFMASFLTIISMGTCDAISSLRNWRTSPDRKECPRSLRARRRSRWRAPGRYPAAARAP